MSWMVTATMLTYMKKSPSRVPGARMKGEGEGEG